MTESARCTRSSMGEGFRRAVTSLLALIMVATLGLPSITAGDIETYAFEKVWWRTDLPVVMNQANRTWVWGPEPFTALLLEPYDEGAVSGVEGARWVQYFDKTRVEITRNDHSRNDDWYVTNGLLAQELISGRMQIGDTNHVQYEPADINVAGDSSDPEAPTYRSLSNVVGSPTLADGAPVIQTIDRQGATGENLDLARFEVVAVFPGAGADRAIASPFWEFMNSEGVIYDGFDFIEGKLFDSPFFATGLPVTNPYWTTVRIAGEPRDVLVQAFQRRVLTYAPDNPEGWRVEAANVGRHYYRWRYLDGENEPLQPVGAHATRDLSGNLILMGEVVNNARASYAEIEVNLTLFNTSGEPIEEFRTWVDASVIEPGERLPFQIWTEFDGEFANYDVQVRSRPAHRFHRTSVTLVEVDGRWGSNHRYDVAGVVRNDSDQPVDFLQFVVALYDNDGRVTRYRWGMIEPATLLPGEEARFETAFFNLPWFDEYRVIITD